MTGPGQDEDDSGYYEPISATVPTKPKFCTFPIEPYRKDNHMTDKIQRVDPSVKRSELELQGEPRGSVPNEVTMRKPLAYRTGGKDQPAKERNVP